MSEHKQKCTVVRVGEERVISEKFKLRELIVDIEGEYPQRVAFQASNRSIDKIDGLNPGDEIGVTFRLRGRESDDKKRVWNTLDIVDVKVLKAAAPPAPVDDSDVPF